MDIIGSLLSLLGLGGTISPLQKPPDYQATFTTPTPTPTPMTRYTPPPVDSSVIAGGMQKFSPNPVPMATMSGQLATAGHGLPDELLPAVLSLMESGGGQNMQNNNPYNIGPGISYPDLKTSIVGGGPQDQKGLMGLLREGGLYQKYRNSGKLEDFFNTFTPPGAEHGNPSMEELISRYQKLRLLFQ